MKRFLSIGAQLVGVLLSLCFRPVIAAEATKFDFENLSALIKKADIRSVEQLLPRLPKEFQKNYVLMKDSVSNQGATPENPRVIVFSNDAKLILAFTGDSEKAKDYSNLEIIQFREKTNSFEFRKVEFDKDKVANISEKNPERCLKCHQKDPRPNWENYRFWPGAYGEKDDSLSPTEEKQLTSFFVDALKHPRYQHLTNLKESFQMELDYTNVKRTKGHHNIEFGRRVAQLNFRRIARLIRDLPNYEKIKYAVIGMLRCARWYSGDSVLKFFPERDDIKKIFEKYKSTSDQSPYGYNQGEFLLSLINEIGGASTSGWSMNFRFFQSGGFYKDKSSYRRDNDSLRTPNAHTRELSAILAEQDPELEKFLDIDERAYGGIKVKVADASEKSCKNLEELSVKAIENLKSSQRKDSSSEESNLGFATHQKQAI